ncbi:membrane lipoprotein lipid attachment site-containing protein [Flavobacterium sp. ALJ2]|uniref:membrane lipoprotein lipid attachment site-containing protein n=1 Tax=Flavobacterium sp. ALJ2 TaxID=2786960 RepID=UPI00189E4BF8|nr:membrane lipoprotein lipid attachment site-containing protein [Flavobacterium sp. ALJ2]MBF7090467.1 membrane lipoprotein lipid attachment site-containing protein [Flavobacterium sp. ALJ2]
MKRILLTLVLVSILSACSNDGDNNSCETNKNEINLKYDNQIQYVRDNPGPNGIDFKQITLLNTERSKKLEEACK